MDRYSEDISVPKVLDDKNSRVSLDIPVDEKTLLVRAAALQHTNLEDFMVEASLHAARKTIDESEKLRLSERDSMAVLDLLENPPEPNEKLLAAAHALPDSA
jgi:uncharacterized protein (DUF1778 family)